MGSDHLSGGEAGVDEDRPRSGGGAARPSSQPSLPQTRKARDSSLRRLRSGTTLPAGEDLRPSSGKSGLSSEAVSRQGSAGAGRVSRSQSLKFSLPSDAQLPTAGGQVAPEGGSDARAVENPMAGNAAEQNPSQRSSGAAVRDPSSLQGGLKLPGGDPISPRATIPQDAAATSAALVPSVLSGPSPPSTAQAVTSAGAQQATSAAARGGPARLASQLPTRPLSPRIRNRAAAFQQQAAIADAQASEQQQETPSSPPVAPAGRGRKSESMWEPFDGPPLALQSQAGTTPGNSGPGIPAEAGVLAHQEAFVVPPPKVQAVGAAVDARVPVRGTAASSRPAVSLPRAALRLSPRSLGEASPSRGSPKSQATSPQSPSGRPLTRRESQVLIAVEEANRAAELWEAEEAVLTRAAQVLRARDIKILPVYPEPKRPKTHWDHLLEEMQWMAKEFAKERKWKLAQCRRFARRAETSEKNIFLRAAAREKEEKLQIKRRASWIGKEVMKFWGKAERAVAYKAKSVLEARKKEALDKHLSFLVDQTSRYSSMLAQRLTGSEAQPSLTPRLLPPTPITPASQPAAASTQRTVPEPLTALTTSSALPESPPAAPAGWLGETNAVDAGAAQSFQGGGGAASADGAPKAGGADGAPKADGADGAPQAGGAEGQVGDGELDDEEDFEVGGEGEEIDDEATLEEEEELAREEEDDTANEIQDLADEADLPLDQLLARYGYVANGGNESQDDSDRGGSPVPGEPDKALPHGEEAAQELAVKQEQSPVSAASKDRTGELQELLGAPNGAQTAHDPDVEYEGSGDEEDDEATLDQEDALAVADGLDRKEEEDAELAALNAEADMPLEQLLAMYDMVRKGEAAGSPPQSDRGSDDDGSEGLNQSNATFLAGPSDDGNGDAEWAHILGGASPVAKPPPRIEVLDSNDVAEQPGVPPAESSAAEPPDTGPSGQPGDVVPELDPELTAAAVAARRADAATAVPSTSGRVAEITRVATRRLTSSASGQEAAAEEDASGASRDKLEGVAQAAAEAQPKGTTFETTSVHTKVPFLLKHTMREYQHIGLDWLVTIYTRRLNGILADEMGLGKTIQTIALLAHLACHLGVWGPHLIVVPTSVMLNWEMEFKKWCPAFKLLTYYGSAKERKLKRQGWSKPNAFHVCITSYTLVLQDAKMFRRKKWKYLILDEAHMIKNWKSQRWQTLLNFNSARRLLITGTPLQNDLMELWSLMHFLMPQVFASHAQFKDWFSNPLTGMVEGQETVNRGLVDRLHGVLRPFLLRRLKSEVEKQMPHKHEHVIKCRLSKRQRTLYEDYMASSDTRATLGSGNFLGIINVLMQLRKVCNHPDLFEGRPIISAFDAPALEQRLPSPTLRVLERDVWQNIDLATHNLLPVSAEVMTHWEASDIQTLAPARRLIEELPQPPPPLAPEDVAFAGVALEDSLGFMPSAAALHIVAAAKQEVAAQRAADAKARMATIAGLHKIRCSRQPLFGRDLIQALRIQRPADSVHELGSQPARYFEYSNTLAAAVKLPDQRAEELDDLMKAFVFAIPKARAPAPKSWCSRPNVSRVLEEDRRALLGTQELQSRSAALRTPLIRQQLFFPDRRLVQFDCGKLQEMATLLRRLKAGGHKALIFTQMTRMLDILEAFLNLHGYTYLRLDGSTKPEQRQVLMQRFNSNPKIFVFILSTRSGGVGMNLTGADTVIFYDSDWNPAMDAQAQDRCHRIGQTREVHIYRLVSEKTIEENILFKSDQKRQLDHLAIQSGGFNTDFLQKFNPRELLGMQGAGAAGGMSAEDMQAAMRSVEDENDAAAAAAAEKETAAELAEFTAEHPVAVGAEDAEGDNEEEDGDAADADDARAPPTVKAETPAPDTGALAEAAIELDAETAEEVAALVGPIAGKDTLASLEDALRPIEKYAVRFLEETQVLVMDDAGDTAAAMELQAQDWGLQDIERQQQAQEVEAEEDGEAQRIAEWDRAAADAAYRAQVERARREQQLLDERAALESREGTPLYTTTETHGFSSRPSAKRSRQRTPQDLDEAESPPAKHGTFGAGRGRQVTKRGRNITRPAWHYSDDDVELSSEDDELPFRPAVVKKPRTSTRSRLASGYAWGSSRAAPIKQEPQKGPASILGRAPIPLPRPPAQVWTPWDQAEDLVLCAVVARAVGLPVGLFPPSAVPLPATSSSPGAAQQYRPPAYAPRGQYALPWPRPQAGFVGAPGALAPSSAPYAAPASTAGRPLGPPPVGLQPASTSANPAVAAQVSHPAMPGVPPSGGLGIRLQDVAPRPAGSPPLTHQPPFSHAPPASPALRATIPAASPQPRPPQTGSSYPAARPATSASPPSAQLPQPVRQMMPYSAAVPSRPGASPPARPQMTPPPAQIPIPASNQTPRPAMAMPFPGPPQNLPSSAAFPPVATAVPAAPRQPMGPPQSYTPQPVLHPPHSGPPHLPVTGALSYRPPAPGSYAMTAQYSPVGMSQPRPMAPIMSQAVPGSVSGVLGRLSEAPVPLGQGVWEQANGALAAGGAALSASAAMTHALQQGKKRTPAMCKARYQVLLNAGKGASGNGQTHALGLPALRQQLALLVQAHSNLRPQELVKTISAATAAAGEVAAVRAGIEQVLADFRKLEAPPNGSLAVKAGASPSDSVSPAEAAQLLEAVKRGCGPAWSTILGHIGPLLSALASGGVTAAYQAVLQELQAPRPLPAQYTPPPTLPRANLINRVGPRPPAYWGPPSGAPVSAPGVAPMPGGIRAVRPPTQMPPTSASLPARVAASGGSPALPLGAQLPLSAYPGAGPPARPPGALYTSLSPLSGDAMPPGTASTAPDGALVRLQTGGVPLSSSPQAGPAISSALGVQPAGVGGTYISPPRPGPAAGATDEQSAPMPGTTSSVAHLPCLPAGAQAAQPGAGQSQAVVASQPGAAPSLPSLSVPSAEAVIGASGSEQPPQPGQPKQEASEADQAGMAADGAAGAPAEPAASAPVSRKVPRKRKNTPSGG